MNSSGRHQATRIVAFAALVAVGLLLFLSMHGHANPCHGDCWLCLLSQNALALPAVIFALLAQSAVVLRRNYSKFVHHWCRESGLLIPRAPPY